MRVVLLAILVYANLSDAKPYRESRDPQERALPPPQDNQKLPASRILPVIGSQCSPERPGSQVGLLIDWRTQANRPHIVRSESASTDPGMYLFLVDGHAATVLNEQNGNIVGTQPDAWHLSHTAYIVEVDVNGGKGMPASKQGGGAFVVAKLHVLDQTKAHPIDPGKVLRDARTRFDKLVGEREQDIRSGLVEARANTPGNPSPGEDQQNIYEHLFPTWWGDKQELEVLYTRVYFRYSATQRYGIELGYRVTYDNAGKIVREHEYAVQPIRVGDQNFTCAYQ